MTNADPSGEMMMIVGGGCVGSIQFCVAHTSGGGGGGHSGGGGGGGGICYYCRYAPPRYTSNVSYYTPPVYYTRPATSAPGWIPPEAPGFNAPVVSIARATFAQAATSNGGKLDCLGPVEPSSCQTEQDLLGAQYAKNSDGGVPRWRIVVGGLLQLLHPILGGHHPPLPDPGQLGTRPVIRPEHPPAGEEGGPGTGAGPEPGPAEGGGSDAGPTGIRGILWPGEVTVIPVGTPVEPPEAEPTEEANSSVIVPPFLPGEIGDFGPGSVIDTGWLTWGL